MPAKKKTNYITYELKKLDLYIGQLQDFLDKNPPNLAVDRIERIVTQRGESIRVIASIEQQVKAFTDIVKEMPRYLEDLNRLRMQVDQDKKEVQLRGGQDRPGFMNDDDEDDDEKPKAKTKKESNKQQPSAFDDDTFYTDENTNTTMKELPAPDESEEEDTDWLNGEDD